MTNTNLTDEQKARVAKLVHALRTTKKQQGRSRLARYLNSRKREYCCLGIACEVAIKDGLKLKHNKETIAFYGGKTETVTTYGDDYDSSYSLLPGNVVEYYGFNSSDPRLVTADGDASSATFLNDDLRYNFEKIADAFERTYLRIPDGANN